MVYFRKGMIKLPVDTKYEELHKIEIELKNTFPTETKNIDFTTLIQKVIEHTKKNGDIKNSLKYYERLINESMLKNKVALAVDNRHLKIVELIVTEKILEIYPLANRKFVVSVLLSLSNVLQVIWSYARIQYVNNYFVITFDYKSVHNILNLTVNKACKIVKDYSTEENVDIDKVETTGLNTNQILFSYLDRENMKDYFTHDKLSTTSNATKIIHNNDLKRVLSYLNKLEKYGFYINKSMLFLDIEDFFKTLPPYIEEDTFNKHLFEFISTDDFYLLSKDFVQADKDFLRVNFKSKKPLSLLNKDEINILNGLKKFSSDYKNPISYEDTKEIRDILESKGIDRKMENEQLLLNDAYSIILKSLNSLKAEGLIVNEFDKKSIQIELVNTYKNSKISEKNPISDLISKFNYNKYCSDIDEMLIQYLDKLTRIYDDIEDYGFEVNPIVTKNTSNLEETMKIYVDNTNFENIPIMPNIKLTGLLILKYLTESIEKKDVFKVNDFLRYIQEGKLITSIDNSSDIYFKKIIKQKVLESSLDNRYVSYIQDNFMDSDLPNKYIPNQLVAIEIENNKMVLRTYFNLAVKLKIEYDIAKLIKEAENTEKNNGKEENIFESDFANFNKIPTSKIRMDRIEKLSNKMITKNKLSNKFFKLYLSPTIKNNTFETRYLIVETKEFKLYMNPHYYFVYDKNTKESKVLGEINISDSPIVMWDVVFMKKILPLFSQMSSSNKELKKELETLYIIVKKGYNRKNRI